MRKIISSLLLFSAVYASAQTDSIRIQTDTLPDFTAIGTPDGKLVSKEIGPSGGKIVSEDGKVELIFPEGALSANTNISIQPVTNMLDSSGKAYQLEPSGTQFKNPVKIIFHYTDDEAETCPPDLKSYALQDHKGKWNYFEYEEWDSTAKTLTGLIHHFSALVTNRDDVLLRPAHSKIGVNATTDIEVLNKRTIVSSGEYKGDYELAQFIAPDKIGWFVNDEINGNYRVGTAKSVTLAGFLVGEYTASEKLPSKNPVEVKMAFQYYSKKLKKKVWGSAKCKIEVFDAYKILLIHEFTGRVGFRSKLVDSASFVAFLYPEHIVIDGIENFPAQTKEEGSRMGITEKVYNDNAPGTIHIKKETKNYKLSKDFLPRVYFEFATSEILRYTIQYLIRRMGIETEKVSYSQKGIPANLEFIANGRTQQFPYPGHKDLTVTITPFTKE